MTWKKLWLHYGGRRFAITDRTFDRLQEAVREAGSGTAWFDLYERGGATGDSEDDITIVVGAGIPIMIAAGKLGSTESSAGLPE